METSTMITDTAAASAATSAAAACSGTTATLMKTLPPYSDQDHVHAANLSNDYTSMLFDALLCFLNQKDLELSVAIISFLSMSFSDNIQDLIVFANHEAFQDKSFIQKLHDISATSVLVSMILEFIENSSKFLSKYPHLKSIAATQDEKTKFDSKYIRAFETKHTGNISLIRSHMRKSKESEETHSTSSGIADHTTDNDTIIPLNLRLGLFMKTAKHMNIQMLNKLLLLQHYHLSGQSDEVQRIANDLEYI